MPVLYHISKHQTVILEVTVTPQSHKQPSKEGIFRANGHCPSSASGPKCFRVTESRLSDTSTLSHRYAYILCLRFVLDSLRLFVFISCSLTLTHVSTDLQVMTSLLQQLRTKRWKASLGRWRAVVVVFFLLIQRVSEQFFCTKGMSVYFLLLNTSPVHTRSLKQTSLSCELPFFFILRWVFIVSVVPRPDLSAPICV